MSLASSSLPTPSTRGAAVRFPLIAAAIVGLLLVLGSGFSHSEIVHNAAHDVRHANSFPCH